MSPDDDASAAKRVMAGDVEAFDGIVRRNQDRLVAFGRRFFNNLADVEDFVQEVFLQAFRRLSTFRGESRFSSWLLSIAYHIAVRLNRRLPDYDSTDVELLADLRSDPEQTVIRTEAARTVVQAMRALPTRFATCLDLFFFFGLTYEEISGTTGHPVNTVRSHIRRAKEQLRRALSDGVPGDSYGVS
jgi:RNA polymerase sigma-70 factor (ECF subfamily)